MLGLITLPFISYCYFLSASYFSFISTTVCWLLLLPSSSSFSSSLLSSTGHGSLADSRCSTWSKRGKRRWQPQRQQRQLQLPKFDRCLVEKRLVAVVEAVVGTGHVGSCSLHLVAPELELWEKLTQKKSKKKNQNFKIFKIQTPTTQHQRWDCKNSEEKETDRIHVFFLFLFPFNSILKKIMSKFLI